jgi:hypothetical protein
MESTDVEPDRRLPKLCLYCSRLVTTLDGPLRQIEQGKIFIKVENPPDFRTWVAAAENGCGGCVAPSWMVYATIMVERSSRLLAQNLRK